MALKNPFVNVFRTVRSKFAKAGASFRTYQLSLGDLLQPWLLYREYKRFKESSQYQKAKDLVRKAPPLKLLPTFLKTRTTRNLKAKYQYIFIYDITLDDGIRTGVRTMSILSEDRLTPSAAKIHVINELNTLYHKYERSITSTHQLIMEGEVEREF